MQFNAMRKLILKGWAAILIGAALFLSLAYQPDYFEVSKQLEIFTQAFKEVTLYYVDDTEPGELMQEALEPMLASLDPYTNYIPEEKVEDFRIQNTGNYGGIGASVGVQNAKVIITSVYEGFAADKANLGPGDEIIAIDGQSVSDKSAADISEILKGSPGTEVRIAIQRLNEEVEVSVKREKVHISSVPYAHALEKDYGYVTLSSFTSSASSEIKKALRKLRESNPELKGLILDLRGNPGGLLSEAVNVTNLFIEKGQKVVETRGKLEEWQETYRTLNKPEESKIPLVVLIDRQSASASEIVAGTLQDYDRAVIVGQRSFGKGLVQQSRKLPYGSQIKVTIAKYYVPSGRCIQAINYAERNEDGSVKRIPDSLRVVYNTANGRPVKGGGGIDPDISIEMEDMGSIVAELYRGMHLFDYATYYANQHDSIAPAADFALSKQDYQDFKKWLQGRDYQYQTATEKALKRLQKAAKGEQYQKHLKAELDELEAAFAKHRSNDLDIYQSQIKNLLEQEIVSRYYYERGQIANELVKDKAVAEALAILRDRPRYEQILAPAS